MVLSVLFALDHPNIKKEGDTTSRSGQDHIRVFRRGGNSSNRPLVPLQRTEESQRFRHFVVNEFGLQNVGDHCSHGHALLSHSDAAV